VLLCRSIATVGLLVLTSAAAQADPIPLPREKPGAAAEEDGDVALSSSCLRALEQTGVVPELATGYGIRGECTMEDPVAVKAVEASTGTVTLPGRPILECQFAAVLGARLGEVVCHVADSPWARPSMRSSPDRATNAAAGPMAGSANMLPVMPSIWRNRTSPPATSMRT
jgi:hypothetical protein